MTSRSAGAAMMLSAALLWGTSYLFMRMGLHSFDPLTLTSMRFAVGFLAAAPLLLRRPAPGRTLLGQSAVLGLLLMLVFFCMMSGLRSTTTGKAGFLGGTTIVFVQFGEALLRRRMPRPEIFFAALLAFSGVALMTTLSESFTVGAGDILCLGAAAAYSIHILCAERFLRASDALALGVWQLGWTALFAFSCALLLEEPRLPHGMEAWSSVLFLGIFCSAGGFLLQSGAQKRIDAGSIGVLYSAEPVFAMLLGIVLLDEPAAPRGIAGALAILAAILLVSGAGSTKKHPSPGLTGE